MAGNCSNVCRVRQWRARGVGRAVGAATNRRQGERRPAVRVLRSGVDGGLAGPGDVAGTAAEQADTLVRGHGQVVAEFFDEGQSRTVAWGRRPRAAALVALLTDACRGWDAIVVGEYERAFYGSQYASMAPLSACRTPPKKAPRPSDP